MTLPLNTLVQLSAASDAPSWHREQKLRVSATVAARHELSGTVQLIDDSSSILIFEAKLVSNRSSEPATVRYALPIRTETLDLDRVHDVAEVLAELAFIAADGHDNEQGQLIRLIGLEDAVTLVNASKPDII